MGLLNLRSLLLAVIVLSNCITWTASRHHYTHNVNGHRSRHRRQGAGLYLSASYIIPGGEGGGAWGEWGEISPCSRTCGGGVASQKRICLEVGPDGQPRCTGGDTKYFSCQTQDCPAGAVDFRAEQCSHFDNVSSPAFRGIKYKWVPYTRGPNPCELNCMPQGERFYYRHREKVVDGTLCNEESFDVCVDGKCQPVGCDRMLGSTAKEDKCLNCRGNGVNCQTMRGLLDSQDLRQGYNDMMIIPQGATSIYITEAGDSSNYLALRSKLSSKNGTFYLNGDYHIDFPRSMTIAGATWYYERNQQGLPAPDKLRCQGPIDEPLILVLLLQDQNVGIEYEYSIPTALAPKADQQYNWVHEDFTPCSASCGGGFQTRNVTCRSREELEIVDDALCEESIRPPSNQSCGTDPCPAQWVEGPWSPCSKPCGQGGSRSRQVHCQKIITNGFPSIVADKECFDLLGPKPELFQECNGNASCPTWFTGPWKPCDKLCGQGKQTRLVVCHQKTDGRVEILKDEECVDEKPPVEQGCMLHPCDGVDWVLTDWSGCDSCLSKVRTRSAECATKYKEVVNALFCAYHPKPLLEEPCEESELPECEVQWYATQWSNCSTDCGKGVQTRKVFCGLFEKDSVVMVNDSECAHLPKYNDTKPCEIPKEKCPAKWFAGPWTACTKMCGGGEQHRRVMCLRENKEVDSCDYLTILDSTKACNIGPCNEDEVLPVDSKSTPIMDDDDEYEDGDCIEEGVTEEGEEEEYEEAGAEESLSTIDDMMFSDSPSTYEGSGFTAFTETEGSGETGSGEIDITDVTTETSSDLSTVSSNDTESTESSEATESTLSGATDETSESEVTSESGATSESEATSESGPTSESGATESDVTTESGPTSESGATDVTESGSTDETTESGATETEVTDSSVSGETSESGATDESTDSSVTEESESTDVTELSSETGSTDETSESSSTDESSESSPTDETSDSSSTDETSESSPTDESTESTSESSVSGSDETTSDETSDSSITESGTTELLTDETTSSGDTESTSEGSTESSSTDESSETEETASEASTESGPTDLTTESGTEESTVSGSDVTTESGATEESTTSGSSDASGSTESEETEPTEISTTEVTGTESTELTESTEFSTTESTDSSGSTESTQTEETESTLEGSSTTEMSSEESTTEGGSTLWDWSTTLGLTSPKLCKRRKKSKCKSSEFGCCPDNRTPAAGPFDEGCPNPETCKESKFGCCPDGVSPAAGEKNKGCPVPPCNETLFGCCLSDNKTAAEGNDQEGCPPMPPACKSSKFGCCADGETGATGPKKAGCPETEAKKKAEEEKKKEKQRQKEAKKKAEACKKAKFGCCYDNVTLATGPDQEGCPCNTSQFGCCPDNNSTATGPNLEGCLPSCASSTFGCCPDNETAAHGYDKEGCCLLYSHGCCPDNYMPARGPNLEGCECQNSRYGCCPDNATIAKGPGNHGCGCQYTEHGCCPDNHTPASGPDFEGCGCHTYQFGCCDDGERAAKGPNKQGCHCRESEFGCCGDEKTPASGPEKQGCNCANSKFGCCPDGQTEAQGTKFLGCTDVPENKQAACSMASDRGSCRNYSVYWFYDMEYGGCSRFWYGGCEGNGNRFTSKEECEDVCVQPAPKDACKLPQVKGACLGYHLRWYYDSKLERCSQFVFGGCLGNANNFDSEELCKKQCEPERSADQCELPLAPGSCAGNYPRWGFNPDSKRCEQFTWGGCEGNPNRFSTEAACKERCDPPGRPKPVCSEPQEVGNCTEKVPAWSFNEPANRCVPFYYSGCGGNDNRFTYEVHCTETCPPAHVKDVCELPAEIGDCADYRQNWYYDTAQKRCLQFYYGGCGGNENNFPTMEQCEARCSEPLTTTTTTTTTPPQVATQSATTQQAYAPPGQEYCFLELDAGPCDKMTTRWGYDSARGQCVTFQYGGCGGNRNNFPDVEYCQYYCNNPQDICQLPMMSGPCDGSEMKWFYDPRSDSCSQFTYGGCDGNGNRFDSLEACERRCRTGPAAATDTTTTTTTTTVAPFGQPQVEEIPPECQVSPTAEECVEAGTVWYLDPEQRACVAYENAAAGGGCRQTGVFPTEEACMRACGPFRNIDVCAYPVDAGPCRESVRKFYFERAAGACLEFTFGGCHGGPNRFSSLDECEQMCIPQPEDPCAQPLEPGNCVYSYQMWYYDSVRDSCDQFIYSGCNGNDNRFDSREDCEGRCVRQRVTTPSPPIATPPPQQVDENCRAPPSQAPCGANITAYYFDESSGSCVATEAGGCRYQGLYQSDEECERNCGAFKGIDVCRYSLDVGPCKAAIPKFYFDINTGRCEPYAYGGCGGSPNRFSSADECQRVCAPEGPDPSCLEEVDTGFSCGELSSRRYYYSPQDAECLPFIFSGCGGTNNNYYSIEQCTQLCKRTTIFDSSENEVTPDCSAFTEECSRLSCPFGVQRSHTADGCERCSCVQVEVNCAQLEQDCEQLKCMYSVEKTVGEDGCTRCKCISHPCQDKECPSGERCVASAYRDPITDDLRYSAECKIVNKPGSCPPEAAFWTTESQCRRECNDDADCRGVGKCCASGCSNLCLEPVSATSPAPRPTTFSPGYEVDCRGVGKCCASGCSNLCLEPVSATSPAPRPTTFSPELPQAPYGNLDTEPEVTGQEGGVATLRCLFHGNPPPKITWRRGEITIDGNVGRYRLLSDGALEIVSLYRNDSGVYICLAENIHGKQHQEIRLQINDPVDMPAGISGDPNAVVTGDLGQSITLRCMAFGYPPPTIVWHRGVSGPMVPFSSSLYEARGYTLLIRKLNEDTLGEYTCEAYNGVGKPTSWSIVVHAYRPESHWADPSAQEVLVTQRAPVTTTTTYAPEITVPVYTVPVKTRILAETTVLAPGAELNLPCEVDGYPLPNVYWSKDGAPLSANSRTQITESRLTITGLTPSDSGVYGCHASNPYSSHQDSVSISVQGIYIPANCTDNPFFANCHLIVQSKFCQHRYYSKFCCKSCMQAGQLNPQEFEQQADQPWDRK